MAGGAVGGAENIFLEDLVALADCDHLSQAVVTRPEPHRIETLKQAEVPVYAASFNKWLRFTTHRILKKAYREFQPDIIQYWMGRAGTFAIPEDFSEAGGHINVAWYGGYYKRKKRFPLCSHHIVLTKDLFRHVEESGVDSDQIGLIHTLADFDQSAKPLPRSEFDTPKEAPLILALARLHWKKGLDLLLQAMARIPEAHCWIAGEGPLREELELIRDRMGLKDRVKFLGWRNDRECLLKACDIVAFPSRYEPFGTVTVDAWAAKRPLVATAAQGPKAYVRDRENGLLVEVDDLDGLTMALKNVINDPKLVETIVEGGWQDYQSTFTKEAFTRDSLDFYRTILNRQRKDA